MGKFYGKVGFVYPHELRPGVWDTTSEEKPYYGNVIEFSTRWINGQKINDDITLGNRISIVADPFAYQHYSNIRYVEYLGAKWEVNSISVERPRLLLSIGGLYNNED